MTSKTRTQRPLDAIVEVEWGRTNYDEELFKDTMAVIRGGVGKAYAEENEFLWKRMISQHRLVA